LERGNVKGERLAAKGREQRAKEKWERAGMQVVYHSEDVDCAHLPYAVLISVELRGLTTLLYQGRYEVCSLLDGARDHDHEDYARADAVGGFRVWE
jgi:hypothetical protein